MDLVELSEWGRNEEVRSIPRMALSEPCGITTCGNVALCRASRHGHMDVVRTLLCKGRNFDKEEPLRLAAINHHHGVVATLLNYDCHPFRAEPAIIALVRRNDTHMIQFLWSLGVGMSPTWMELALVHAIRSGHYHTVALFLRHVSYDHQCGALEEAEQSGHTDVVQLIKNDFFPSQK